MLVVVQSYSRSPDPQAQELGSPNSHFVGNQVRAENERRALNKLAEKKGFELVGVTPLDECLPETEMLGLLPFDLTPDSPAVRDVEQLTRDLQTRAVRSAQQN